jgi:hypothetical protein
MRGLTNTSTLLGLALGVALGILIADWVKPRVGRVLGG